MLDAVEAQNRAIVEDWFARFEDYLARPGQGDPSPAASLAWPPLGQPSGRSHFTVPVANSTQRKRASGSLRPLKA